MACVVLFKCKCAAGLLGSQGIAGQRTQTTSLMAAPPVYLYCSACGQKLKVKPDNFGETRCKTSFQPVERSSVAPAMRPCGRGRWLNWLSWSYLLLMASAAASLHGLSELWWPNTLFLYSPRWVITLPLLALVPAALVYRRKSLLLLTGSLLIWSFLLAGLTMNWPGGTAGAGTDEIRVMTCNLHGGRIDKRGFQVYLDQTQPDIVLLQECDDESLRAVFSEAGWSLAESGHLWVASRLAIEPAQGLARGSLQLSGGAGAFNVSTRQGPIRLINVHLPTPRNGLSAVLSRRWEGVAELRNNTAARSDASATVRQFSGGNDPSLIVAGDFNSPIESNIMRDYWGDLSNAFSQRGLGFGATKYTRWHGVRIDHILFGPAWSCRHCGVGPNIGSDHRPVFAVLEASN